MVDEVIKIKTFFNTNNAQSSSNGSGEFIKEFFESPKKFKGGLFGIEVALSGDFGNVLKFESHIAQEGGDSETECRYDLKVGDTYIETKNWSTLRYMLSEDGNGKNSFRNQFLAYLGEINSIDNLKYVFKNRPGISLTAIKSLFKIG